MTARYPLVIAGVTIEEIQIGDTYDLSQGASLPLATGVSGVLPVANGGTGTSSTTFVNLTSNVTGVLPVANGGTNLSSYTANGVLFASSTSALAQSANLSYNSSTSVLTVGTGTTGGISGGTF
jgi:hypothetical protein